MKISISCCVAVLLTLPLSAQETGRSTVGSTTSILQIAGAGTSFRKVAPIRRHVAEIGIQTSASVDSPSRSRTPGGTAKSSASGYVIGGAIIGAVAAGAGLALYFSETHAEFVGSPFVFVPFFAASAGIGAGIGYILYRARR